LRGSHVARLRMTTPILSAVGLGSSKSRISSRTSTGFALERKLRAGPA